MNSQTVKKLSLGVLLFAGFILLLNVLPIREWLEPVVERLEEMGTAGRWLYVGAGILFVLAFVPVTILISLAGFFFGFGWGFVLSMGILFGGLLLGALLGDRFWPAIKDREMFQQPVFQSVREVLEESHLGLVALLRMTPFFHFMTGNLFLGSLRIKLTPYLGYSLLGMVPGTLLVVAAGHMSRESIGDDSGLSMWKWALFGCGVAVFAWVSWYITRKTREKLDQAGT